MSVWDVFRRRPAATRTPSSAADLARARRRFRRRDYEMAEDDRLASKWKTTTTTADGTVRYALAGLRARARELEENDPYIGRYFQLIEANVVGETGINPIPEPPSRRNGKTIDQFAASRIADAFHEWGKRGTLTVCGRYSWVDLEKRILRSTATDGELFIRIIEGPEAGNEFGLALEVLESDLVDETYSTTLKNGNAVRMGVELDRHRRPVAYHFLDGAPGDYLFASATSREVARRRIPAADVIHCALWSRMRPGQTRAVTWFANVGPSLYQLHAYRKAEAIAARLGSEKMGFYVPDGADSGDFTGDHSSVDESAFLQESEPGAFEILPDGYKFQAFDVDHPSTAFEAFNKALTRTASAGLGVGYNALASDLESVSYSSMRAGALEDRAFYRNLQTWHIETFGDRIYKRWLEAALISGAIRLSPEELPRLEVHRWQTRGWQWVDPAKEAQGNQAATELGAKLVGDVIAETSGRSLDEQLEALRIEREKFAAVGLRHPTEQAPEPAPEVEPNVDDEDDV